MIVLVIHSEAVVKQAAVDRSNAVTTDSTATAVAGTSIAAASISSASTELVTVDSQSSNRKANALGHVTTAAEAYTDADATIDAVAADTTAITAAGTAIVKKSKLTSKSSKLAQGFTSSITSVVKKGVKDHGSKIEVAVEAFGAVAEHIPYVCHAWRLCNEVILLFSANAEISSNCAEVVSWAQQMQVKTQYTTLTLHYCFTRITKCYIQLQYDSEVHDTVLMHLMLISILYTDIYISLHYTVTLYDNTHKSKHTL
jgi:hypothetical protein